MIIFETTSYFCFEDSFLEEMIVYSVLSSEISTMHCDNTETLVMWRKQTKIVWLL